MEKVKSARLQEVFDDEFIRTEVNTLLLPIFFLSKRGKKQQIEYKATIEREGTTVELVWRVFPSPLGSLGPFEKEVFRAMEYLVLRRGLPVSNPIPFSLYDLCKLMGMNTGGTEYRKLRMALRKITLTGVQSEGAFYSKRRRLWINDTFHLYERVVFTGEVLPDGGVAETNYLWLGSWYLESLNAFYLKPLDYNFYRSLHSPIAKRLYELLGVKFYGAFKRGNPYVHYRYTNLCDLLPIKKQRYLSKAREKMDPAHGELLERGFLGQVEWLPVARRGDWLIRYFPGPRAEKEVERLVRRREWEPEEEIEAYHSRQAEDMAYIEGFASYIAEELGDEKSLPFYRKLAKLALQNRALEDLIHRSLSEVKDEWHRKKVRRSKGALFTDKLKRYCRELDIELPGIRGFPGA